MKKQTAFIVVGIFLLIVVGASTYIYKSTIHVTEKAFQSAVDDFNNGNSEQVINNLKGKVKTTDERLLLATAYLEQASVNLDEKNGFDLAKPLLEAVLSEDENNSEALRLMAYGNEITENFDEAFRLYDKAIMADNNNSLAFSGKAHAKALRGELKEAISLYQAALSLDSQLDHASLGLARIYLKENINLSEAVALLDNVIKSSDNKRIKAEANQMLGVYYLSLENTEKAKEYFEASIVLDETLAQSYIGRAQAKFAEQGKVVTNEAYYDSILKDLEKATVLNPELTMGYYVAAVVLELTGNDSVAQNLYKKALDVVDEDISLSIDEKLDVKSLINSSIKK